jgi:hypothetical protein
VTTLRKLFGKSFTFSLFGIVFLLITSLFQSPVIAADSSEGGFHISQWTGETWEKIYLHQFQVQYSTKAFTTNVVDGKVDLKIVQTGMPFADIDQISLVVDGEELIPEYARYTGNGQSVLEDVLELDHNVVIAHEQEIEIFWDVPGAIDQVTVYLTANEYGHGIPFQFPQNGYAAYEMGSNPGSITVDGLISETDGTIPSYSPFWRPATGHPDGYTFIYINDDEQYVYFSLDITLDNSNEYGEDWAEIRLRQPDGSEQAFRVDDFNTTWGKAGFGLTSKVSYKHQTCEFAIPKNITGSGNIEFSLAYYGTGSPGFANLIYLAGPGGNIDGVKSQAAVPGQTGSSVTAKPNPNYHFVKWSDGKTNATRKDIAPSTGILEVTATFAIDTFTLTYTAGANGSISGTSLQTVDYGYDGSPVTAEPDTGYHFVDWSDGSTDNPRTETNVTSDVDVLANFALTGAVGGEVTSVNTLVVLAPWLILAVVLGAGGIIFVSKRRSLR